MKLLLTISSVLLILSAVGRDLLPTLFSNMIIFWSIKLALVSLLSVGFAISLSNYFEETKRSLKSFSKSACFLFLFLCELIIPITVHYGMDSLDIFELTNDSKMQILDTNSLETEEKRKFIAGLLFQQYGVKIPYELDQGGFVTFDPTKEQVSKYNAKLKSNKEAIELNLQLRKLAWSSFILAIVQAFLFYILFATTIIFINKTRKY
jgi:hypothetical protein